jgi:anti-sigma factor RsiW
MTCEQLLRAVNLYVEGTIEADLCAQLERHLGGCTACQVFVDTVRKTVQVYKGGQVIELPVDLRARLDETLRAKWRENRFGTTSK